MVNIRESSFSDFEGIKALEERYGLETKEYEEWRYLWENNPAVAEVKQPWPMGWVIEDHRKQIVGYLGNFAVAYEFKGKRLVAAAGTCFVVESDYRNYSLLLIKRFFGQKCADLFLDTTANYEAGRIFSAFRARKVPVDSYEIPLFWITNYKRFISSAFIKKALPLGGIIKYPLSLAMWSRDRLTKRGRYLNGSDGEVEHCLAFDERFDLFWDDLRRAHPNRLLRVRDSRHLNWYFKHAIASRKIWITVLRENSTITAYAVFFRQDTPKIGLRRIRLIDLQSADETSDNFMKMISSGIRRCRKEGIDMLEVIGFNPQKRDIIERGRPYQRRLPNWPFFYKARDLLLEKALENPEAWDPCLLDGDSTI